LSSSSESIPIPVTFLLRRDARAFRRDVGRGTPEIIRLARSDLSLGELAERIGMPEDHIPSAQAHPCQPTHRPGVDFATNSKRLGHAKPSVTLAIYAHMFTSDDRKAAAINAALKPQPWVAIGWQCSHICFLSEQC
jgi:hypothetical protein